MFKQRPDVNISFEKYSIQVPKKTQQAQNSKE